MDVTCDRCATRYEFDEALVSSKGTTVKCTNCGHQFKVHRAQGALQLDGWTIRTTDGKELYFGAMRKLQAAISNGAITRDDILIPRDGGEPRRLSRIEELQSFFHEEPDDEHTIRRPITGKTSPGHRTASYPPGRLAPSNPSMLETKVRGGGTPAPKRLMDRDGGVMPSRTGNTLRPPASMNTPNVAPQDPATLPRAAHHTPGGLDALDGLDDEIPPTPRRDPPPKPRRSSKPQPPVSSDVMAVESNEALIGSRPSPVIEGLDDLPDDMKSTVADDETIGDAEGIDAPPSDGARMAVPPARARDESEFPVDMPDMPEMPISSARDDAISIGPMTPSPSAARPSILRRSAAYTDPRFSTLGQHGKRPGLARWVVGIIAVGMLAVGGLALVDRYAPAGESGPANAKEDSRVDKFLEEGDRRLNDGDIEGAKAEFIKASGITDGDPRISRGLAKIEVITADMLWLHTHLLEKDSPHRKSLESQLAGAVKRARNASDLAANQAPEDPLSVGLQIDVLRLEGKRDEARQLVSKLDGVGPDGGRSLALLDLLEDKPNYGSVIDRLRSAARAERKLARAQALLVYALARAERKGDASKELDALKAQNASHPMLAPLQAFVDGTEAAPAASASATAKVAAKPPPTSAGVPQPAYDPPDEDEPFANELPDPTEYGQPEEPPPVQPPDPEPSDPGGETPPPPPEPAPAPAPTIDTTDLPM
jgi:predicted Zn finger-like uncharacterized protein